MKRFLFATSLIALCSTSIAQTTYKTSPNGLLTTEGYQSAYIFGECQAARMMFFDGEMRNNVMVMKEVALRHDYRKYNNNNGNSNSGQGRNWSSVTLNLSYCDHTNISHTFSNNSTNTPALVFSASVTFPVMSGFPTTKPASWDLKFPFSQAWINNGSGDICLDFDFNGGVLANNGRWSTSWYQTYRTDADNLGDSAGGTYAIHGTGCTDSTQTNAAQSAVFTNVYSSRYPTVSYQNKYRISTRTSYTSPGKIVVHAVSLFGSATGTNFPGVSCEKVFIDLTQPFFLFPLTAGTGTYVNAAIDFPLIPYNANLAGVPFWVQGAWDNTANGALMFTYAERTELPPMPSIKKRYMIYQPDTSIKATTAKASQGSLQSPFYQATHNPIFRYAQ